MGQVDNHIFSRRDFIAKGGLAASAALVLGGPAAVLSQETESPWTVEEKIPPTENLMREHGVLRRLLLIYEEGLRRISAEEDLPLQIIEEASNMVRSFVQNYHEKLEEDYVFPRFRAAGKLGDLVDLLQRQHLAGRQVVMSITNLSKAGQTLTKGDRKRLNTAMQQFIRMYNPHADREDTVVFTALRQITPPNEFIVMGDEFEKKEMELFGKDGYEKVVNQVAALESALKIYELSIFTPPTEEEAPER